MASEIGIVRIAARALLRTNYPGYFEDCKICGLASRVGTPPPLLSSPMVSAPWYTPEILVRVVTFVSKVPIVTGTGPPNLVSVVTFEAMQLRGMFKVAIYTPKP